MDRELNALFKILDLFRDIARTWAVCVMTHAHSEQVTCSWHPSEALLFASYTIEDATITTTLLYFASLLLSHPIRGHLPASAGRQDAVRSQP